MAIPDYETLMLPILQFLSDGENRKTSEVVSYVSDLFNLTDEERKQLIPSGRAKLISNRVGWACTYLRKAGLISSQLRGWNQITENGQAVLSEKPGKVDNAYLSRFEAFQEFRTNRAAKSGIPSESSVSGHEEKTPEEIIGLQKELINYNISRDLLDLVLSMEPDAFEQMVVDLLIAMGYGGSVEDAGRAIGKAGDGGIDG
ncbi:MAG: winged helix-turn-helix domain-containing protein, partial [Desulfosalsimonadaceae bacterium]